MLSSYQPVQWPSWPVYTQSDSDAVLAVIRSNQLFAADQVQLFESHFSSYIGVEHAVAVGNATHGLHLALAALGIGQGDEVITPNYSFISSTSCILMQNAIPVLVDLDPATLAPSCSQIESLITSNTKAIIVTHLWGFPCKIDEIQSLARKYNLPLIEDASHAHGAVYLDKKIGSFSDISVFSLHQRKNLPVGDGGICLTSSPELREKLYRLRSFGHTELSYNYRMTEFAGALGVTRLKLLDAQNSERRSTASVLDQLILDIDWISSLQPIDYATPVYHSYIFFVNTSIAPLPIDEILSKAHTLSIPLRKTWQPLHRHPHLNPNPASMPARGIPWSGRSNHIPYINQLFPIGDSLIDNSILQIDIHPGTRLDHLEFLAHFFRSLN